MQIIADRQERLRTEIATYLGQLDGGDLALAKATLEVSIEPLTDTITNDLLSEQNDHLAEYATQPGARPRPTRAGWSSAAC